MLMLIQFTVISRRVSMVFKVIGITGQYLMYLVLCYLLMLLLMAMIVWQVWGDKLAYFRNPEISMIYTLALFDLKTMYLAKDFMGANQFGVDSYWLFILVILFSIVLHYTVTLQYSAFFHIYYKIAQKYEHKINATHNYLKPRGVVKDWFMEIKKNPFKDSKSEKDEEAEEKVADPMANLRAKKKATGK